MKPFQRPLGYILIALAILQGLDWLFRLLFGHYPLIGFVSVLGILCPGNGFASYCGLLAVLLYGAYGFAVIAAPLVLGIGRLGLRRNRLSTLLNKQNSVALLTFAMASVNAAVFFGLSIATYLSQGIPFALIDTGGKDYLFLMAMDAMFVPAVGYSGLYLLRSSVSPVPPAMKG